MTSDGSLRGWEDVTWPADVLWIFLPFTACTAILTNTYITLPLAHLQHSIKKIPAVRLQLPKRITLAIPSFLQGRRQLHSAIYHPSGFFTVQNLPSGDTLEEASSQTIYDNITYLKRLALMPTPKHSVRGATFALRISFFSASSKHTVSISIHRQ